LVLPNAVRGENLLPAPTLSPDPLPAEINDLPRPIAGVIGNLAENTDWELLEPVIDESPWLSWAFVGPYSSEISNPKQAQSRERILGMGGRIRFTGPKEYGELKTFARAFDVAILPYLKREPTYSGSSTRFYEHLAACRPMIATRGFEELLHKEPALTLADTPSEMLLALEGLRASAFEDGLSEFRWRMSYENTWQTRAKILSDAVASLCDSHISFTHESVDA
jgi:hypothetical protein